MAVPINRQLQVGLRGQWSCKGRPGDVVLQGDLLGIHNLDVHGGYTFPPPGYAHFDRTAWADFYGQDFLTLGAGDRFAAAMLVNFDTLAGADQYLMCRYDEWAFSVANNGVVTLRITTTGGAAKFAQSPAGQVQAGVDQLLAFGYDGVSPWVRVHANNRIPGDAYNGDIKIGLGGQQLIALSVGRLTTAATVNGQAGIGSNYAQLYLKGMATWVRRGNAPVTVTDVELDALRTGGFPLIRSRGIGLRAPLAKITKSIYLVNTGTISQRNAARYRVGPANEVLEVRSTSFPDDASIAAESRLSLDEGKTWTPRLDQPGVPIPDSRVIYAGVTSGESWGFPFYDPASGLNLSILERQFVTTPPDQFNQHCYLRLSDTRGQTWRSQITQFTYEAGAAFNPANPLDPAYLQKNQCSPPNNICRLRNGDLAVAFGSCNYSGDPNNNIEQWRLGAILFILHWTGTTYTMTPSNIIGIDFAVSPRGLLEPVTQELNDGTIMVLFRGSATAPTLTLPWMVISRDGGRTIEGLTDFRYTDGGPLSVPSAGAVLIRHPVDGRLYWSGNPLRTFAQANSPRFPWKIGLVDEGVRGLIRESLTLCADRRINPTLQTAVVQYSNVVYFIPKLSPTRYAPQLEGWYTDLGHDNANSALGDAWKATFDLVGMH